MEIDRSSGVQAREEIMIYAPVEVVWNVQSDLERWPEWNPDITSMVMKGGLRPGTEFRWKANGAAIVSCLQEVIPNRRLVWTGRMPGIRAVHVWTFHPGGNGTVVKTEESFTGFIPWIVPRICRSILSRALQRGTHLLKQESERRDRSLRDEG